MKFSNAINKKYKEDVIRDINVQSLLHYYFANSENLKKSEKPKKDLSIEFFDYYESFDTGLIFDSIVVENAKSLKNKFFVMLKERIKKEFENNPLFASKYLSFDVAFCNDGDPFINLEARVDKFLNGENSNIFLKMPSIEINSNGMVYVKIENVNPYDCDISFAPHCLYLKNNKYGDVDDMPVTVRALQLSIKYYFSHLKYDLKAKTFSLDDSIYYGGLSKNNLLCKYIDFLNQKYLEFCLNGYPEDYKLFPEEVESALNELLSWSLYGANKQNFIATTENGVVYKKRPGDFIRDFQFLVGTLAQLQVENNWDCVAVNSKRAELLLKGLNIIKELFVNDSNVLSPEQSLKEYLSVVENNVVDPIDAIANCAEGYWNMQNPFAFSLLAVKVVYAIIDEIRQELIVKNKRINARPITFEKGLTSEEYSIMVHEKADENGKVSFVNRYKKVCEIFEEHRFWLLNVSEKLVEFLDKNEKVDEFLPLTKIGNVFIRNFTFDDANGYRNLSFNKKYYAEFKIHSALKAIDNCYEDLDFKAFQLVNSQATLQELKSKYNDLIVENGAEDSGYNLMLESKFVNERLNFKKQIKEEYIRDKQRKHDKIFNFAFAVFGAFGVASSIVEILISDSVSKIISLGSMMLYLCVVLFSFKNNKN